MGKIHKCESPPPPTPDPTLEEIIAAAVNCPRIDVDSSYYGHAIQVTLSDGKVGSLIWVPGVYPTEFPKRK